jgi:RND family efflux transporter MFP subunit
MKKTYKNILIAVGVLAAGALFYNKVYIPKTTYERITPTVGEMKTEVFGIGNVGAKHLYSITAQTGGRILAIHTDEGEWVKKGDLLIQIDSVDIPQLLEESKIAAKKAESEYIATEKEMQSLVAQKHLAEITYRRYLKLKERSFASKAEFDKAKADLDVITAQIAATKAHITSAGMEVDRAKKSIAGLEEKLSRYKIYAPIDGYVIARKAEVAQSVLPSQVILQIVSPEDIWVKAYIDEKLSGSIKVGQHADIKLRSQYERVFKGYVKRIVAESDPVTQEREVDVAFNKVPIPFYINEQAEVTISSKTYKDAIKIPAKALTYYQEKPGVWTAQDGRAHFIPVKILTRDHHQVAVEGIDKDTEILLESPKKKPIKEGSRVH